MPRRSVSASRRKRSVGARQAERGVNAKGQPSQIEIYRSGSALWVVIDGYSLPMGWISDIRTGVHDDEVPWVEFVVRADRVVIDNSMYVIDRGGPDGEAEGEGTQEAASERVRLSEDEEVSD